jgi:predicted nucleic acid-binding protein
MALLVDTSVWSLAFRRDGQPGVPEVDALRVALQGAEQVFITGLVLQELLQGSTGPKNREQLVERLTALSFLQPDKHDHIAAAEIRNVCRRRGIQIGTIDALLIQLCQRYDLTLLTGAGPPFAPTPKLEASVPWDEVRSQLWFGRREPALTARGRALMNCRPPSRM